MKISYNYESLFRHNISKYEVDEVYALGKDFDVAASKSGYERIIIVGWTAQGRLLEIGIEYLPNDHETIFHANDATAAAYKKLFHRD